MKEPLCRVCARLHGRPGERGGIWWAGQQLCCKVTFIKTSCSSSFPFLACGSHTMARERGMPGMYANAVPLGTYGSPYARPLMGGQQQIPKLLSSKWVPLPTFPSLKNILVLFWSVALLQIKSGFRHPPAFTLRCSSLLLFLCAVAVVKGTKT